MIKTVNTRSLLNARSLIIYIATNSPSNQVTIKDKRAVGIEVIIKGQKRSIRTRKEVILSAGAIGSAQVLMLSGIGPKKQLQDLHVSADDLI